MDKQFETAIAQHFKIWDASDGFNCKGSKTFLIPGFAKNYKLWKRWKQINEIKLEFPPWFKHFILLVYTENRNQAFVLKVYSFECLIKTKVFKFMLTSFLVFPITGLQHVIQTPNMIKKNIFVAKFMTKIFRSKVDILSIS